MCGTISNSTRITLTREKTIIRLRGSFSPPTNSVKLVMNFPPMAFNAVIRVSEHRSSQPQGSPHIPSRWFAIRPSIRVKTAKRVPCGCFCRSTLHILLHMSVPHCAYSLNYSVIGVPYAEETRIASSFPNLEDF